MVEKLFSKEGSYSKIKTLEHLSILNKTKAVVLSLVRETGAQETVKQTPFSLDLETESKSPLSTLCESYVSLMRLTSFLTSLIIQHEDKPTIIVSKDNLLIYKTYWTLLQTLARELKHNYRIWIGDQNLLS